MDARLRACRSRRYECARPCLFTSLILPRMCDSLAELARP